MLVKTKGGKLKCDPAKKSKRFNALIRMNHDNWNLFISDVCFQADVGQDEDFEEAREKAIKLGAKKVRSKRSSVR